MKKAKLLTLKNIIDKKLPPSYIKIDGHIYERLEVKTAELTIDLDGPALKIVNDRLKSGGYVNAQEVIREAVRSIVFDPSFIKTKK